MEDRLKRALQSAISRGKVEVALTLQTVESRNTSVAVDHALAGQYITALRALGEEYALPDDLTLSTVCRLPDIFTLCRGEEDEEELAAVVLSVLQKALEQFVAMRETEGERLKADVLSRLLTMEEHLSFVEERSPQTVAEYRARLTAKLTELLNGAVPDENRILTEVGIIADRLAVDEETVRLRSHFAQLRNTGIRRTGWPQAGLFGAGDEPRDQYHRQQVQRYRHCRPCGGNEERAGKDPRADPEHRISERSCKTP